MKGSVGLKFPAFRDNQLETFVKSEPGLVILFIAKYRVKLGCSPIIAKCVHVFAQNFSLFHREGKKAWQAIVIEETRIILISQAKIIIQYPTQHPLRIVYTVHFTLSSTPPPANPAFRRYAPRKPLQGRSGNPTAVSSFSSCFNCTIAGSVA